MKCVITEKSGFILSGNYSTWLVFNHVEITWPAVSWNRFQQSVPDHFFRCMGSASIFSFGVEKYFC